MILDFKELEQGQTFVGSKAYVLAMMAQNNLPVPAGMILSSRPENQSEWSKIKMWWADQNLAPLAVRSSAYGEDSEEMSFAGQNQTFLNVVTFEELQSAVENCFRSIDREASQAYRQHFMGDKTEVPMNVVLQVMVDAKYAGVYFSVNPTKAEDGEVLEYLEGLGESLVSGQVNPFRIFKHDEKYVGPLQEDILVEVFKLGEQVEAALAQKIDMEWAVDDRKRVFLLQARPITAIHSEVQEEEYLKQELARITSLHDEETWWDGQTFAEWTGQPSRLTFEVWKRAFAPGGAFDDALKELGYLGFTDKSYSPHESIMDRIFGRAFINMSKMVPLYFGPIPYRIDPNPKPHLKFEWYKVSAVGVLNTPSSLGRMLKVGWRMSTARREWIEKSRLELTQFNHKMQRPADGVLYKEWKTDDLLNLWQKRLQISPA